METLMTSLQKLEAWRLKSTGLTLDEVCARLGLQCSKQTVWRGIHEVTTADERIKNARRTGNYEVLDLGEILIALSFDDDERAPLSEEPNAPTAG